MQTPRCRFLYGAEPQILAAHLAAADQAGQLIARLDAAGPGVGMLVDADLVERRRVDAVEPVGHIGELKGAAVLDDRAGGEALARETNRHEQDEHAHQGLPAVARAAPIGRLSHIGEPWFGLNHCGFFPFRYWPAAITMRAHGTFTRPDPF